VEILHQQEVDSDKALKNVKGNKSFQSKIKSIRVSLSKTTVNNTLRILVGTGLIRIITIEDNEIRYDIVVENHGHFKCESCGTIYNFRIDVDLLISELMRCLSHTGLLYNHV